MRVAVVSSESAHPGKTALSLLLTNIYPNATGKEAVYVTNGELNEMLGYMQFNVENTTVEQSVNVITTLASTENITDNEITDYAYRPKNTNAMLFDAYPRGYSKQEANKLFMSVLDKLGNRFVVVDISGDITDNRVQDCINTCDVILFLFEPDKKQIGNALNYYGSLDEERKAKIKFVCTKWNELGLKKKQIQELTKIRANSILWFPYHVNIQRTMFEGRLCILNRLMIEGRDFCVSLRQPLKDILSAIYDTPGHKVIKEVNQWVV